MEKYGVSIGNLIGTAEPDQLVDTFAAELKDDHGKVQLHFYPFGGMVKTLEWIADYIRRHGIG